MEIKRIISLCKKSGRLILFENDGEQWISDGAAIFPLKDMPRFDKETICRTYDISEKKAGQMDIRHEPKMPDGYNVWDNTPSETPCDYDERFLEALVPVKTSEGLLFIQKRYLSPFRDTPPDMLYLYERHRPGGGIYFAVKVGFELVGVVSPFDCVNEDFVGRIKNLYEQCEVALFNKREREKDND